ncbi:MAG: tetratricopeptide repeat protein [Candidatus Thorarchaeota archaeon]
MFVSSRGFTLKTKDSVVTIYQEILVKPFGTITRDFQFVESSTREILEEILEISPNYPAFTKKLCKRASSESASDELVLLAIQHSSYLNFDELKWKVLEAQSDRISVRPHILEMKAISENDWDTVIEATEAAIDQANSEWETFLQLLHLYKIVSLNRFGSPLEERTQRRIEKAMDGNPALEQYSPSFYLNRTIRLRLEGDVSHAQSVCEKGLSQARNVDDRLSEIFFLWQKAELIGVYSFGPGTTEIAKQILREAIEISDNINCKGCRAVILELIQVMCHMRGEYSEAYEISLEILKMLESIGKQDDVNMHNLSAICNEMGNGREALEWANQALRIFDKQPFYRPVAYLDVAWSLINLGKLDEAEEQLNLAREYLYQSGYGSTLAIEQMVSGLLERALGDYDSALTSLEKAWETNLRENRHNRATSCLVKLAETEVMAFKPTPDNIQDESAGIWLTRLEEYGEKMDLPGVIALALFLKGELRFKQGRLNEAKELDEKVHRMSELPGLAYLKDKAHPAVSSLKQERRRG